MSVRQYGLQDRAEDYPIAFIVHMATVLVAFASWPYSKFVHLVYRFLALVKDEQELASTRP
jgi:nitrate reductase gamma subunit